MDINSYIQTILKQANQHQGSKPSQDFVDALNAYHEDELPSDKKNQIRINVAESLPQISSYSGAGFIGLWLGGSVENGGKPEDFIPHLYAYFTQMMKKLTIVDEELAETPENDELIIGLKFVGQALVAHLARSKEMRDNIADDTEAMDLIEEISVYSVGANWVYELLIKHSDELIVLHGIEAIGVRIRYKNLSNCFHLFTLLQETLGDVLPHEDEFEDEDEDEDEDNYYAWWHYGQATSSEADFMSTIWGEMSPKGISIIDETQVMIVWPHLMASRSWDEGFLHPQLEAAPASLELIEVLSNEEVKKWRKRLSLD